MKTICAQRLSASLESSLRMTATKAANISGAQRLSASLESSPPDGGCARRRARVLNAFRHHWNLHRRVNRRAASAGGCSTPFGIIGIFTLQESLAGINSTQKCSTPFGIIGIFTLIFSAFLPNILVLNAFRHHWNLHARPGILTRLAQLMCSTPFGIIGIFTRAVCYALARHIVLNAFRHHWNLHRRRDVDSRAASSVLNAFRHHWNLHFPGFSNLDSTPLS